MGNLKHEKQFKSGDTLVFELLINLNYRQVINIHENIQNILSELTGSEGMQQLSNAIDSMSDGSLAGLFQICGQESLEVTYDQYLNVIANLMSAEAVMAEYIKYLDYGSKSNLTRNLDQICINTTQMYKSYDRLEEVISQNINILKGVGVDESVEQQYQRKNEELQNKIEAELRKDPPGNPQPYIILKNKLNSNNAQYKGASSSISNTCLAVKSKLQEVELSIKLLEGDIQGFSEIWNVFKYTPDDANTYIETQKAKIQEEDYKLVNSNLTGDALLKATFLAAAMNGLEALAGVLGLGEIIGGAVIGGVTVLEDYATFGLGVVDDPFTLAISAAAIANGINRLKSLDFNRYAEKKEFEQYLNMYNGYKLGLLDPDTYCDFLQKTYNMLNVIGDGQEISNDYFNDAYNELSEDDKIKVIGIAQGVMESSGYIPGLKDSCAEFVSNVRGSTSQDYMEGKDDEQNNEKDHPYGV